MALLNAGFGGPGLHEQLGDLLVPLLGRGVERALALLGPRVHVRAAGDEELHDLTLAVVAGKMERDVVAPAEGIDIRALGDEGFDNGRAPAEGKRGLVERRGALAVTRVGRGAAGEQQVSHRGAAVLGGLVESRSAMVVRGIHLGAGREEHFDDPRVPLPGGVENRGLPTRAVGIGAFREEELDG